MDRGAEDPTPIYDEFVAKMKEAGIEKVKEELEGGAVGCLCQENESRGPIVMWHCGLPPRCEVFEICEQSEEII